MTTRTVSAAGDYPSRREDTNRWKTPKPGDYDSMKSGLRKARRLEVRLDPWREYSCAQCGTTARFSAVPGSSPLVLAMQAGWAATGAGRWLCQACYGPWATAARARYAAVEAAAARERAAQEIQAIHARAAARKAAEPPVEEPLPVQGLLEDPYSENPVDWRLGK